MQWWLKGQAAAQLKKKCIGDVHGRLQRSKEDMLQALEPVSEFQRYATDS